jgi:hypothetical protein
MKYAVLVALLATVSAGTPDDSTVSAGTPDDSRAAW